MKKVILLAFVLLLSVGLVFAADDFGDINTGDDTDAPVVDEVFEQENIDRQFSDDTEGGEERGEFQSAPAPDVSSDKGFEYTQNFYIALGVAGGGILFVILFLYLFLRKPKNKWKKHATKLKMVGRKE